MTRTVILRSRSFELISWGNGLAYELRRTIAGAVLAGVDPEDFIASLFLQGDDALAFEQEREVLERVYPTWSTERIMAELWERYT